MDPTRFDTLTKAVSARLARRTALAASAAGLAALTRRGATSQESTPEASPTSAGPIELLFVQTSSGGSLVPTPGEDGVYTLTLTGETGQTVYFADRPSRATGAVPTAAFVDGRAFDPADPPNAALVVETAADQQDVLVIELTDPVYDADTGTVMYTARLLADYRGEALAPLAVQQTDTELAGDFGAASLFVDNLTCLPERAQCSQNSDCCSNYCIVISGQDRSVCGK